MSKSARIMVNSCVIRLSWPNILARHFVYVMLLIAKKEETNKNKHEAMVMPALCFLRIQGSKATTTQIGLSICIIVVGVVSALVGTYSSLASIATSY
ncbi:hypothetical protein Tco_1512782 [Tanacetum coccineum]